MLLSADEELDDAMISLLFTLPRNFRPRFHALGSRPFRVAAIYEYGLFTFPSILSLCCGEKWIVRSCNRLADAVELF